MEQFAEAVKVLLESRYSQDAKGQAISFVNDVSSSVPFLTFNLQLADQTTVSFGCAPDRL